MPEAANTPINTGVPKDPFFGGGGSSQPPSNDNPPVIIEDDDDEEIVLRQQQEESTPDESAEPPEAGDEQPPENKDKTSFNFDDFLKAKGQDVSGEGGAQKEQGKPKAGEAGETKPDNKAEGQASQDAKGTPAGTTGQARDYTGLTEEEAGHFKRMSNAAFSFLLPKYKASKAQEIELVETKKQLEAARKGQVVLPDNYYEHPHGYLLTPEYAQAENTLETAQIIHNHWRQQMINIRAGKDWQELDYKDGKLIVGEPQPATAEAEMQIGDNLEHTRQQLFEKQQIVRQIQSSFAAKYKDAASQVKESEDKFFPGYDKPDHPQAAVMAEVINRLPAPYKKHPLASMLAKVVATNAMLHNAALGYKAELDKAKAIKSDAKKAGPTAASFSGAPSNSNKSSVTFEDFLEAKRH